MKKAFVLLLCTLLFVATTAMATQPFATENGARLMDPVEFSDGAVYCNDITYSTDPALYANWYVFVPAAGDDSHLTVAEGYMNALLDSGYYELTGEDALEDGVLYDFDYIGTSPFPDMRYVNNKADILIYTSSTHFILRMHPSLGFITEPVKQDLPQPGQ